MILPVELFETLLDRLEDESDIRTIRDAGQEPLYDQKEAEEYIFMNRSNANALIEDGLREILQTGLK